MFFAIMLVCGGYLIGTHDVNSFAELSNLDITAMVGLLVGVTGFLLES